MTKEFGLIGGIEQRPIIVVPPDPTWPARFATERDRITTALGTTARRVDHIGSTSVPGLAAKPIIDIQVSVADIEEESYVDSLLAVGYELRVRENGHRMVRTPARDVHVHICEAGSDWERRHLLFRDWLRHDPADLAAYQQLKQRLAGQEWPDMNAYADAKGPLVMEIIGRAETWAEATGWTPINAGSGMF
ncbi:MAG TPA: GrpB family protein [Pseudonocardiaceae bacterium]|nr:GrpB family protein [Pseudonocardiaceae bacterium]